MSLLPLLFDCVSPLDLFEEPSIPRGAFALTFTPRDLKRLQERAAAQTHRRPGGNRLEKRPHWKLDKRSPDKENRDTFQVSVDVEHFAPNEISVKTVDKAIVIEGKHEERNDGEGFVSRQFVRRYHLPEEFNIDEVSSSLSSDGVLTVKAPLLAKVDEEKPKERIIQIQHTGPASRCISMNEKKEEEEESKKEDKDMEMVTESLENQVKIKDC